MTVTRRCRSHGDRHVTHRAQPRAPSRRVADSEPRARASRVTPLRRASLRDWQAESRDSEAAAGPRQGCPPDCRRWRRRGYRDRDTGYPAGRRRPGRRPMRDPAENQAAPTAVIRAGRSRSERKLRFPPLLTHCNKIAFCVLDGDGISIHPRFAHSWRDHSLNRDSL